LYCALLKGKDPIDRHDIYHISDKPVPSQKLNGVGSLLPDLRRSSCVEGKLEFANSANLLGLANRVEAARLDSAGGIS
jgi:hypothetical protein